ncbi:acyltransferase [Effusibacillus dendaii]|uniref:Membrane protein n=1 Tax=Effusibacillus dendaii TaxID=2743772 RepID=A0A7I8DAD1_9BACL|nr:acyltransferase [Effusibacillus dendaii]BCJ87064.1 membrane protein [Effusibacillus dendaii]
MSGKDRISEIQYLRGIAFCAVAMQHVIGVYNQVTISLGESVILAVFLELVKFAVPTFVFITGLVLFYNYNEGVRYPSFIWKRIKEILIPYLIWSVLYAVSFPPDNPFHVSPIREFTHQWITGTAFYHLWFVVMIFQFYLLYPLFQRLMLWFRTIRRQIWLLLVSGILYLAVLWASLYAIPRGLIRFDNPILHALLDKYRDRNFLLWFFYFLLGAVAGLSVSRWRDWIKRIHYWNIPIFLILFAWVTSMLANSINLSNKLKLNANIATSLRPSMFWFSVSSIALVYVLSVQMSQRENWLSHLTESIGKYSYGAYLIHALVLQMIGGFIVRLPIQNHLFGLLLTFVGCVLLSWLLTFALSKLPFGHLLVGTTKKKKPASPLPASSHTTTGSV